MYLRTNAAGTVINANYNPRSLKVEYPNTSFPRNMSAELLASYYVFEIAETTPPSGDVVTEAAPAKINGVWTQQWDSRDFTTGEVQQQLEELQASIIASTQAHLDKTARDHGYDGILSACSYTTSIITRYKTEGDYCVTLRDATWSTLETILAEVQAGTRAIPSSFADIEDDLPAVVWPT